MSKNDSAFYNFLTGDDCKLTHEESVGQAVEAKLADAGAEVTAWDGKQLGDARKMLVKRGVKTSNLRYFWERLAKALNECDFSRQVVKVERLHSAQFSDYLRCDELVVQQVHSAVDHAMSDCADLGLAHSLAQVIEGALKSILERCAGDGLSIDF